MGEGQGFLIEGNQEGIRSRELEGGRGGGGVGVTWGRLILWELQTDIE